MAGAPDRRPGGRAAVVLAALLLLGSGGAAAVGVLGQDPGTALAAATVGAPPSTAVPVLVDLPTAAPVELPVSVEIPAIDVESPVLPLGAGDGAATGSGSCPDHEAAAWSTGSPRPGERGPAVFEGHVDSAAHLPAVFHDLGELTVGDQVEVTRADGTLARFTVYETRVVPGGRFPTLALYGDTEEPELRLITCGGPSDSSPADDVVVFAR
ncbi:sortase domain-containing protein [Modestobacter sp. VKM Ac-2986]|uniref:sortase domain-containing protein n=1 Tax=Modestobacter sp. VKM Ac-2986 TaxID=3004140 RepID=UPI0022AA376D|nr:sortase [Modestobacter sp. VKM Ac-2986]